MILIACWNEDQDTSVDLPVSVRWGNGSDATLDDYRSHRLDTHTFVKNAEGNVEVHIFPSIVAQVTYDPLVEAWRISGRGVIVATLENRNPLARDFEIREELGLSQIVYRAHINREPMV